MISWLPISALDEATAAKRLLGYGRLVALETAPLDARVMVRWAGGWCVRGATGSFSTQFFPTHWSDEYAPPDA